VDNAVSSVVKDIQAFYIIVLALSVGEAFKQVIPEAHRDNEGLKLRRDQLFGLFGLISFLVLVLPFFQGMSRHFFVEYKEGVLPDSYSGWLMLDCIAFTIESALFFLLSRRLPACQWKRFYRTVALLLGVDGVWVLIGLVGMRHNAHMIRLWLVLDIVFLAGFLLLLLLPRKNYFLGATIGVALMLARTGLDYGLMWDSYFPPVQQQSSESDKQKASASDEKIKIYFGAPLFTQAEWRWNATVAGRLRDLGFEVVLPQERAEPMLKGDEAFDSRGLFSANVADIERADVVVAVLDGADADSGTCWESGYAYKAGRPVIGLRTDLRGGGDDPKAAANLMLSQSCSEFVTVPPAKRDDTSWVSERIAKAIRAHN
jgi:nucleoside 2-deoxyribosyltransferase